MFQKKKKTTLRYDDGDVTLDELELTIKEGTLSYIGVHQQNRIRPSADQTEYGTLGLLISKQEDGEVYVPVDMLSWQPGPNHFVPVGNGTQRHDLVPGTAFFLISYNFSLFFFFVALPQMWICHIYFFVSHSLTIA